VILAVPVIVLFTKADLLDAQTIERLHESGMSIENAASKAGEESINNFYKDFGHMLYAKKYPPETHAYFRGKEFYCLQRQ
jgi:methylphosphotriester-DNA--protein-cysteine methyltransferase